MKRLPNLVFIVDVGREETAVHECNLLGIPIVALLDTNCNPQNIDYVIPSNDDAIRAIKLLVAKIADAVLEGKAMRKDDDMGAEEEIAFGSGEPAPRKPVRMDNEEELDDAALLGQATLAKLSAPAAEEDAVEEPVVEEPKTEEPVAEKPKAKKTKAEKPAVEAPKAEAEAEDTETE
jgi:small subunit ribosomal protein S2